MGKGTVSAGLVVFALVAAACTSPTAATPTVTAAPLAATTTTLATPTTTVPPTTTLAPPTTTTTAEVGVDWEAIRSAEWLVYGPDGIVTSTWVQVWMPNVTFGDNAIFRDGSGGFVWNDLDGLWWLESNAPEPKLVLEGQVSLYGVTPTYTGPVAQISLSRWVELRTGADADPPETPRVRAGDRRPPTWTAANGLSAMVIQPSVLYDAEGQPLEITGPARLIVTKGDIAIVDIPVGSFYSPWVRLHDFNGQRLIISRGPFEPALPEETFFVIDLACGACMRTFTAAATSVALVGREDSDWDGSNPDDQLVQLVAAWLGSDEGVDSLADGVYLGFLQPDATSESQVSFDLAAWFSGPDANRAAAEDGETDVPVPNDFYIRNRSPKVLSVPVAADIPVTSVWFNYPNDQDLEPDLILYTDLLVALSVDDNDRLAILRFDPWWITIEGGKVVRLDEQYVP